MQRTRPLLHIDQHGWWILLLFLLTPSIWAQTALNSAQERGRQIFETGESNTSQDIIALMSGVEVPASVLPCASCHGSDGKGKPEGGIVPSNLTWPSLTRVKAEHNNRIHPAYTLKALNRAISMGLDPAGNALHKAMPRYQMSRADMNDLVAYIQTLGIANGEGVQAKSIDIGMVLPPHQGEAALAARAVVEAYFTEINQEGGIYNRILQLQPAIAGALEEMEEKPFAMTASFISPKDEATTKWLQEAQIPIVGAMSDEVFNRLSDREYFFYLYPGLEQQALALVEFAQQQIPEQWENTLLLHGEDEKSKQLAQVLEQRLNDSPWKGARQSLGEDPSSWGPIIQQLRNEQTDFVFLLLQPQEVNALLQKAAELNWQPNMMMLGALSGAQVFNSPLAFHQKLFLTYPTWLSEISTQGMTYYRQLQQKYQLPNAYRQTQLSALAASIILVESMKKAGRQLSREKLMNELQQLYEFRTGLIPPISYNKNNRIGSERVYVTTLNLKKQTLELLQTIE
ncbi:MAG: ABC transporter substrate-binding protein [Bacteroidota bacterium]